MEFNHIATLIFGLAILHTFFAGKFNQLAHHHPEGSMKENIYHFLGEIEVVFGIWLIPLFVFYVAEFGYDGLLLYLEGSSKDPSATGVNMTEPLFVIVIMVIAATRPVINFSKNMISFLTRFIYLPSESAKFYVTVLIVAPILGSFITEPAAMTIAALQLKNGFFKKHPSEVLKYTTIGLLFVNVSIGGTLTHFAAPPVLMVQGAWEWDIAFMISNFGWKSVIAIVISTTIVAFAFLKEFKRLDTVDTQDVIHETKIPFYVTFVHILALAFTVFTSHHPILFILGFMFFLGWCAISDEYQDELQIKPALLVGFFLAGLVIHGGLQKWWITPLIASLDQVSLFFGSTILTAFNDNAAITYLSSLALPSGFSDPNTIIGMKKFAVVAGAVSGGGLTIIANAPNPAGNSILKGFFGEEGINPLKLFLYALPPTIIAGLCLMLL